MGITIETGGLRNCVGESCELLEVLFLSEVGETLGLSKERFGVRNLRLVAILVSWKDVNVSGDRPAPSTSDGVILRRGGERNIRGWCLCTPLKQPEPYGHKSECFCHSYGRYDFASWEVYQICEPRTNHLMNCVEGKYRRIVKSLRWPLDSIAADMTR